MACEQASIEVEELQAVQDEEIVLAKGATSAKGDKVTICHYDTDLGESYQISISVNGLNGHDGHERDMLPEYIDGAYIPLDDIDGDGIVDCADCYPDDDTMGEKMTWYQDAYGDGFGNPDIYIKTCVVRPGYVADNTDCDDNTAAILGEYIFEWAAPDGFKHYVNIDYYNPVDGSFTGTGYFIYISHYSSWADGNEPLTVYGTYDKILNTLTGTLDYDNNGAAPFNGTASGCDGLTGENILIYPYIDADGDGFSVDEGDFDDTNAAINPGATEVCGDGIDNDCDGTSSDWNLVGTSVLTFGASSMHDMTIVSVTGNSFEGFGGYPSGAGVGNYTSTWVVTGTFTNSVITSMYIDYDDSVYWVNITSGGIDSNGILSGVASTQLGTTNLPWSTTAGAATCN